MARRLRRALTGLALALVLIGITLSVYVWFTWNRTWDVPMPNIQASTDPAAIARGEYLVYGPAHCVECHAPSAEAVDRYIETGDRPPLSGGIAFPAPPLGVIYSRNLTPDPETGIGRASDGAIGRMLRYAVKLDGKASVRPLMQFATMSDDDLAAIVSFLRAQPPVVHKVPDAEYTLVGKIIKSLSPAFKPRENVNAPKTAPASGPTRERGEYLARGVGNCSGCHSRLNPLTFTLSGPEFSGGDLMEPRETAGVDRTLWFQPPNLTPLKGSAINRFPDRATFVARVHNGGFKFRGSPMPWECFMKMTDDDAGALYEFLKSLPPAGVASPEDPTVRQKR